MYQSAYLWFKKMNWDMIKKQDTIGQYHRIRGKAVECVGVSQFYNFLGYSQMSYLNGPARALWNSHIKRLKYRKCMRSSHNRFNERPSIFCWPFRCLAPHFCYSNFRFHSIQMIILSYNEFRGFYVKKINNTCFMVDSEWLWVPAVASIRIINNDFIDYDLVGDSIDRKLTQFIACI